jgi:hypothetical protein
MGLRKNPSAVPYLDRHIGLAGMDKNKDLTLREIADKTDRRLARPADNPRNVLSGTCSKVRLTSPGEMWTTTRSTPAKVLMFTAAAVVTLFFVV